MEGVPPLPGPRNWANQIYQRLWQGQAAGKSAVLRRSGKNKVKPTLGEQEDVLQGRRTRFRSVPLYRSAL